MFTLIGTYQNGVVKFNTDYKTTNPVKVMVTFLEDITNTTEKVISPSDFSFSKSRKILEKFKGSLSDAVIEERRKDV